MKNKLIILAIVVSSCLTVYSQTDSLTKQKIGINVETHFRYYHFNGLNKELKTAGFNELLEFEGYSLGLSGRYLDKNTYTTGNITWIQSSRLDSTNKKASLDIFEYSGEMHWVLSKSSKWFIYPYLGIGLGFSVLTLSENSAINNFTGSIQNLSTQDKFVKKYFSKNPLLFTNFGAGVDRKIKILFYYMYVGINFGYRLSTSTSWGIVGSPLNRYNCFELTGRVRLEFNKKIIYSRPKYFKYIN